MVIAEKATGKIGKHVTSVCVILTLYGSCCVVIVLMGGFLENIAKYANPDIGMRYLLNVRIFSYKNSFFNISQQV